MSVQLKIRSGRVLVDHDKVECPEIVRDAEGTWIACSHDDHKQDERESERKARLETLAQQVESENPSMFAPAEVNGTGPKRTPRSCECGCGEQTKVGRFVAGHDAKLKSRLLKMAREGDTQTERIVGATGLEQRNWIHFL